MKVRVDLEGPDFFCPDCGRQLVEMHTDGSFDLAGEAIADIQAVVDFEGEEAEGLLVDAVCLRCHPEAKEAKVDEMNEIDPRVRRTSWKQRMGADVREHLQENRRRVSETVYLLRKEVT